jgi:putative methionine-R-sulfoxide reductase with GAF domain
MQNSNLNKEERLSRNAFLLSVTISIMMGALSIYNLYLSQISDNYISIITTGLIAIVAVICAVMSKIGRSTLGILILVGVISLITPLTSLWLDGQGLTLGILVFLALSTIAQLTLPDKWEGRIIIFGGLVGAVTIAIDLYGPPGRESFINPWIIYTLIALLLVFHSILIYRRYDYLSIRTKLIVAFIFIALIGMSLSSVMNSVIIRGNITEQVNRALYSAAAQTANTIDSYIDNKKDTLRTQAQLSEFVEVLGLNIVGKEDDEIYERTRVILYTYKRQDPIYTLSYALLDHKGVNILDTNVNNIGGDESNFDYHSEPYYSGLPYASPVMQSTTTPGVNVIYFSSPVRLRTGKRIGVIRAEVSAAILQKTIAQTTGLVGPESYTALVDENGIILAHGKDPDLIMFTYGILEPDHLSILQGEGRLPPGTSSEFSLSETVVAEGLSNAANEPFFDAESEIFDGETVSAAVFPTQSKPWKVMLQQPQEIALEPVDTQVRAAIVMTITLTAIFAIIAAIFAQLLSNPIKKLTETAEKVGQGDLSARSDVKSEDEIGILAKTFNMTTEQLANTVNTLEQRVAERTRAIETSAEVSRSLSTILDQDELVNEVVEQLQTAFNYYHVHIYLTDDKDENLVMAGGTGEPGKVLLAHGHKIEWGHGVVGRSADRNIPSLVADVSKDPDWMPNPILPDTKSEVAVPISIGEDVLGVLDVQHNITDGLSNEDVVLLQSIANQVAIALLNAREFEQTQNEAEREAMISEIHQKIQRTTTVDDALKVAVREIGKISQAQQTLIRLSRSESDNGK